MGCPCSKGNGVRRAKGDQGAVATVPVQGSSVVLPCTAEALASVLPDMLRVLAVSADPVAREYGILLIRKGIAQHVCSFTPAQLSLLFKKAATTVADAELIATVQRIFETPSSIVVQDPILTKEIHLWTQLQPIAITRSCVEVQKMLIQLNSKAEDLIVQEIEKLQAKEAQIDYYQFHRLCHTVAGRQEFDFLFEKYANDKDKNHRLTAFGLLKFLHEEQHDENATIETANAIIRSTGLLTRFNFASYFGSFTTNPAVVRALPPHWDEQPLQNYYISSSFHTYLAKDQVQGPCSLDMYRYVLLDGCRCLELECWDGEIEPVVFHGQTVMGSLPLRKVLEVVKQHAFVASTLPVIMSFDTYNTTPAQQIMIAHMVTETFGELLAGGAMFSTAQQADLTPKELHKKILIKSKQLPIKPFVGIFVANMKRSGQGVKVTAVKAGSAASVAGLVPDDWVTHVNGDFVSNVSDFKSRISQLRVGDTVCLRKENISDVTFVLCGVDDNTCQKIEVSDDEQAEEVMFARQNSVYHQTEAIAEELSHLVYLRNVHHDDYRNSDDVKPWEVVSRQENLLSRDLNKCREDVIMHNTKRFCRVYPEKTRTDSSNMDPVEPWAAGVQLVALNWQTKDDSMRLYRAKFMYEGGGSGFSLKPEFLRDPIKTAVPMTITVRVITGHCLPLRRCGASTVLHLKTFIRGHSIDSTMSAQNESQKVAGSAWNTAIDFKITYQVALPEVAFLIIRVYEDREDTSPAFIAESVLPLSVVRPGYRVLQLWDEEGTLLDHDTTLLCHFIIKRRLN